MYIEVVESNEIRIVEKLEPHYATRRFVYEVWYKWVLLERHYSVSDAGRAVRLIKQSLVESNEVTQTEGV